MAFIMLFIVGSGQYVSSYTGVCTNTQPLTLFLPRDAL